MCLLCFQSAWGISVNLVIGPDVGISYLTEKASSVSNIVLVVYKNKSMSFLSMQIIFFNYVNWIQCSCYILKRT